MQRTVQPRAFTARPPARAAVVRVVCKGVATPTKASQFRALSDEEINAKIGELKKNLAGVRFVQRTRGLTELSPSMDQQQPDPEKIPKGHLNSFYRRQVAQLYTVLRERTKAAGATNKEWKKATQPAALY